MHATRPLPGPLAALVDLPALLLSVRAARQLAPAGRGAGPGRAGGAAPAADAAQ